MTIDIEKVKKAIEEGYIVICPSCGSFRISRRPWDSSFSAGYDYDCDNCNKSWNG